MIHEHKTESTWQQGCNAFRAGFSIQANPYNRCMKNWPESLDHNGWENGWMFARDQWRRQLDAADARRAAASLAQQEGV